MKKKILNLLIATFLLIGLLLYIGAEDNSTSYNDSGISYSQDKQKVDFSVDLSNADNSSNANMQDNPDESSANESIIYNQSSDIQTKERSINETINDSTGNITQNTSTNIPSFSSKGSNQEDEDLRDNYYISSTDLQDNSSQMLSQLGENTSIDNSKELSEYVCLIQNLGEKVIEINDCEEGDIENIRENVTISELEKGEFEKEVTISSEEHFDKPFVFYSSLTKETKKEDIKIYWENEGNLEITSLTNFSVQYYDEDQNGLIEKISWIVPHLSEQVFKITLNVDNPKDSFDLILLNITGPSKQAKNPISFNFNINYSSNFTCELKIGSQWQYNISSNQNYSLNLPNGNYSWEAYCFDNLDRTISNATAGYFEIKEEFFSSLQEGKLYLLDLIDNKIKNPETVIINSTNPSSISLKISRNGSIIYTQSSFNSTYLIMNESILNSSGIYSLSIKFDEPSPKYEIVKNFSVASTNIILNTTQIQEGQSVKITAIVDSPSKKIIPFSLGYGDGSQYNPSYLETNQFNQILTKRYLNHGQYTVNLTIIVDSLPFTIQKNGITVADAPNPVDNDDPNINLMEPDNKEIIYEDIVNFSYKASDNVKIQNCTFKLYGNCASMNYCSTSDSNLIFPLNSQQRALANNYSVQNNKEMNVNLKDFDDGIYEWVVECYDNSSNYNWEIGFFEIIIQNNSESSEEYEQKEEITYLKEKADDFINTQFSLDEKEILEDLNILNDTKYYKKRLLDIENFFKENYKYVSSETLREKKTEEYLQELENIRNKIPLSLEIKDNKEYIKNSVDVNLEEVVEGYFNSKNTQISKSSIKRLAGLNREIQNELSITVKAKSVEITYENGTQEMVLVKKEITLNDDSYDKILEIIPKEIAEDAKDVIFLTENKIIEEDPVFEIDYGELEKEEIIYYLPGSVKLKDIEKTETLLFEDNLNQIDGGVTGFFVVDFVSKDITLYILLIFVLIVLLLFAVPFIFKKFKMIGWKKEPNVVKVLNLIEDINRLLKEKEIEKAREAYYKIKEIYPVLPQKTKAYFYSKINEVLVRIDRKDIFNLVKEYQEAKRKWNKEDVMRLYEDIKKIYERLPEKDRKNVYSIINGY